MPLLLNPAALWGSRLIRYWVVYASLPTFSFRKFQEKGAMLRPRLTVVRLSLL